MGVRHAVVENPRSVVYARLPGFRLAEAGREETRNLAAALAAAPVKAVHASPLDRAVETAEILAEPHGLEVRLDERLLEWSFWMRWEGIPWDRISDRDPELLAAYADDPAAAHADDPLERVGARVLAWASEAEGETQPGELALGVSHEAPLIAALLVGRGSGVGEYHSWNLPHLGAVRLRPGPPEVVDLHRWAAGC